MIGERVRHARDFCALTQTALADLAGLPQSRISEIELGRIKSTADDIQRIARATGFPSSFFTAGPLPDLFDGHFRRLKRGKAVASRQVRAQARQIVELVQRAESVVTMPPVRVTPVRNVEDIEDLAAEVRHQAGLGRRDPIRNVTRAVERSGVVVAALPGAIEDHSGFSAWPEFGLDGRPIILFSRTDPGDRQRFTVAHELGHLLMHSPRRDDEIELDIAEREANQFAAALLLPRDVAVEAMQEPLTLTQLANLKAVHGASIGVFAQRARDLELISHERFVSLRKQMTSRGWHRNEPVQVPPESPLLIRKILDLMAQGDSIKARAESVHLPVFAYRALGAANAA